MLRWSRSRFLITRLPVTSDSDGSELFHQPLTSDSSELCNARFSDAVTAVLRMNAQRIESSVLFRALIRVFDLSMKQCPT